MKRNLWLIEKLVTLQVPKQIIEMLGTEVNRIDSTEHPVCHVLHYPNGTITYTGKSPNRPKAKLKIEFNDKV